MKKAHHIRHRKTHIVFVKGRLGETCDDACHRTSAGEFSCQDKEFDNINNCVKLSEHFYCNYKCLGGYGPEKPASIKFSDNRQQICYVNSEKQDPDKVSDCSASAENAERLCPCGPKQKLADTNKIMKKFVDTQTKERRQTQAKIEELAESFELLFDRLKGARSRLFDTTKTLQQLREEDEEITFLTKLMEAAQKGDIDYESGDIVLSDGRRLSYKDVLSRLSALHSKQRMRRDGISKQLSQTDPNEPSEEDLENSNKGFSDPALLTYDMSFMEEIAVMLCAAAIAGTTAGALRLPPATGYLAAGMIVGPSGLGLVTKLSSVSTISQFGVVFPLFTNGMQFGLKLVDHSRYYMVSMAVAGMACLSCVFFAYVIALTTSVVGSVAEAILLGIAVSLSSPTGAMETLSDTNEVSSPAGKICLGTLAVQDLLMGLLLSIPHVIVRYQKSHDQLASLSVVFEAILRSVFTFGLMIVVVVGVSKGIMPRAREFFKNAYFSKEIILLGLVAICLSMALVTETMGLSLEMGAFFAGLMLTSSTEATVSNILTAVHPLNDIFGGMFLTSIGLVLNPAFVLKNFHSLFLLLMSLIFVKAALVVIILRAFRFRQSDWLCVGLALAQIAEYSLAFTGKAHALGLVSRRSYLFFLTVTVLSTAVHPLLQQVLVSSNLIQKRQQNKEDVELLRETANSMGMSWASQDMSGPRGSQPSNIPETGAHTHNSPKEDYDDLTRSMKENDERANLEINGNVHARVRNHAS